MSKNIETLVDDIYALFDPEVENAWDQECIKLFGTNSSSHVVSRIDETNKPTYNSLRMSNVGNPCRRKLWYSEFCPDRGEQLRSNTKIKFLFGDLLEELLLFLSEAAGHEVVGRQDTLHYAGIEGHRDAIIDGELVDVKSASSFSFKKFKEGTLNQNDPFGYIDQLNLYLRASADDPLLKRKDRAHFLVIDKQHGHICLNTQHINNVDYETKINDLKFVLSQPTPPDRPFSDVPDGKSGNRKLDTVCSYCNFKEHCWPGLRTFIYSSGPRYLTNVDREPDVTEV